MATKFYSLKSNTSNYTTKPDIGASHPTTCQRIYILSVLKFNINVQLCHAIMPCVYSADVIILL